MQPLEIETVLSEARRLFSMGEFSPARNLLETVLRVAPADHQPGILLARVLCQLEGLDAGLTLLSRLEREAPAEGEDARGRDAHVWLLARIELLLDAGRYAEAAEESRAAAERFPLQSGFPRFRLDALELGGEPEAAAALLDDLLAGEPTAPDLLERRQRLKLAAETRSRIDARVAEARNETVADAPGIPTDAGFLAAFADQFAGREGVHALQAPMKGGQWGYRPIHKGLDPDQVKRHLSGDVTLGAYLIRRDNTSRLMVFDLDVVKACLSRFERDPLERRRIRNLLWSEGRKLVERATEIGLFLLPEFSGFKGLHFWALADEPIPAKHWRAIGQWLLERIDAPPRELHWELFPKQDRVEPQGLGNLVKIPLGVHGRSKQRSYFLATDTFKPFPDQGEGFRAHPKLTREGFKSLLGRLTLAGVAEEAACEPLPPASPEIVALARAGQAEPATPEPDLSLQVRIPLPSRFPAEVENLLSGCRVLWDIVSRAMTGSALDPAESHVLVYVFTILGEEGRIALHQILNQAPGYSPDEVNRAIRAVPPNAISCQKIRRLLPGLSLNVGCGCEFRVPLGGYPSPVIHAGVVPTSNNAVMALGMGQRTPAALSRFEEHLGASAGIDSLMREYRGKLDEAKRLAERLKLLRRTINRLFDESGGDLIATSIGEYRRLPTEPGDETEV